ncbi:MAG: isoprenylcysteine carboxylmethyltransferase family protein [Candidatus Schekmanbacteria bacterium]|nr:isoprenylcysteine carboxylmethyltransferase family protein [Candidatus Schekmanbacteria bacterium]
MPSWPYQVFLPIFAVAMLYLVFWKRRSVRAQLGRSPVVVHQHRDYDKPEGFLILLFIPGTLAYFFDIGLNAGCPELVTRYLAAPAWRECVWAGVSGFLLMAAGIGLVGHAMRAMGLSWRIGIDAEAPGPVVSDGPFRFIRHPIYTGMLVLTAGLALATGDVLACSLAVGTAVALPIQARLEEAFLCSRYPEYAAYMGTSGRFFPGIGRRRTTVQ